MRQNPKNIPVIDLFAGPGGLGEGFSSFGQKKGKKIFRIALSVEKDPAAHSTLLLRSFFRQFDKKKVPTEYYSFLRSEISLDDLFNAYPDQADSAKEEALHAELGKDDNSYIDFKIRKAVSDKNKWVLIGGPPCQAYSLAGRSRNRSKAGYEPEKDKRHLLYREYLRIIAEHKPPVFVMENVKGLLSSKIHEKFIFDQIIRDLKHPKLNGNSADKQDLRYEIFSFVNGQDNFDSLGMPLDPRDFIIKSEEYGIPQSRHRVILLGIRQDMLKNHVPGILTNKSERIPASKILCGLPRLRSGLSGKDSLPDSKSTWKNYVKFILNEKWIKDRKLDISVCDQIKNSIQNVRVPHKNMGGEYIRFKVKIKYKPRWYLDSRLKGCCNHASRNHLYKDLHRYFFAACYSEVNQNSPTLDKYPVDLLPDHENASSGYFDDRFRVQVSCRPATTITSHISKDGHYYIHPDPLQCRSLTVREAARIQTFPDNYFFMGTKTQQYVQVGNAVPPLLAFQIAEIVYEFLKI